jgi:hypothetical protein
MGYTPLNGYFNGEICFHGMEKRNFYIFACWLIETSKSPSLGGYNYTICTWYIWFVVWNICFLFFHILGMSSSQLYNIFQRGRYTTNQILSVWVVEPPWGVHRSRCLAPVQNPPSICPQKTRDVSGKKPGFSPAKTRVELGLTIKLGSSSGWNWDWSNRNGCTTNRGGDMKQQSWKGNQQLGTFAYKIDFLVARLDFWCVLVMVVP